MNWRPWAAAVVAAAILAVMLLGITGIDAWSEQGAQGSEDFDTLVDGLFDTHVIALEVLGVLLTAAMIGAMVIARPLTVADDSVHYPTKLDRHQVSELAHVADVTDDLHATVVDLRPVAGPGIVDLGGEEE